MSAEGIWNGSAPAQQQSAIFHDVITKDGHPVDLRNAPGWQSPINHHSKGESDHRIDENWGLRGAEDDGPADAETLLHFRSDISRHIVAGDRPVLFFLRPNEGLTVARVEGTGRLLVTLREEAGDAILVDGAVVYDSAAHFGQSATSVSSTELCSLSASSSDEGIDGTCRLVFLAQTYVHCLSGVLALLIRLGS